MTLDPSHLVGQAKLELDAAERLRDHSPRSAAAWLAMAAELTALAVLAREGIHPELPPEPGSLSAMLPEDHPDRPAIEAWGPVFARLDGWRAPNAEGGLDPVPDPQEFERLLASARGWRAEVRASVSPSAPEM